MYIYTFSNIKINFQGELLSNIFCLHKFSYHIELKCRLFAGYIIELIWPFLKKIKVTLCFLTMYIIILKTNFMTKSILIDRMRKMSKVKMAINASKVNVMHRCTLQILTITTTTTAAAYDFR